MLLVISMSLALMHLVTNVVCSGWHVYRHHEGVYGSSFQECWIRQRNGKRVDYIVGTSSCQLQWIYNCISSNIWSTYLSVYVNGVRMHPKTTCHKRKQCNFSSALSANDIVSIEALAHLLRSLTKHNLTLDMRCLRRDFGSNKSIQQPLRSSSDFPTHLHTMDGCTPFKRPA